MTSSKQEVEREAAILILNIDTTLPLCNIAVAVVVLFPIPRNIHYYVNL